MKRYVAYEKNVLRWIQLTPKHWDCVRLKRLFAPSRESTKSNHLFYIGMENVESWTGRLICQNSVKPTGVSSIYHAGNILFGKLRPYLAKVYLAQEDGICSGEFLVLQNQVDINQSYYRYLLCSYGFISYVSSSTYGAKMPRANWDFIGGCIVPVPPRAEQDQIVRYLDWQVLKINRLIAAKRKEIELLNTKRQQELSHVVQYGLNPHDLIQETGIRWIGQTPKRWGVTALKRCASLCSGITLGRQYPPGTKTISVPYLRVANVQTGYVDTSDIAYLDVTEEEAAQYQLPSGCVLMTEGGDRDKLGRGCVWNNSIYPCIHQNHVFAVTTNDELLCNRYLEYLSASDMGRMYFDITAIRTTNLACTNATKVLSFTFPLPERREQDGIIEYLDNLMTKYAKLISSIQGQISTLNDLRTRLIFDVVTGQMDVRGIEVPDFEKVEDETTKETADEEGEAYEE